MLCGRCGKKEATVHIQKIVNGKVESMHLCQDCAGNLSGSNELDGINLSEILLNIAEKAGIVPQNTPKEKKQGTVPVCPICGWDLERFHKTGYLGCPECYTFFEEHLHNELEKMHRGSLHTGKVPPQSEADSKALERRAMRQHLKELQTLMELHVAAEEYEEAAKLRDKIKQLTAMLESGADHDA